MVGAWTASTVCSMFFFFFFLSPGLLLVSFPGWGVSGICSECCCFCNCQPIGVLPPMDLFLEIHVGLPFPLVHFDWNLGGILGEQSEKGECLTHPLQSERPVFVCMFLLRFSTLVSYNLLQKKRGGVLRKNERELLRDPFWTPMWPLWDIVVLLFPLSVVSVTYGQTWP